MISRWMSGLLVGALLGTGCSSAPVVPDEERQRPTQQAEVLRIEVRDQSFTRFTAVAQVEIVPPREVRATEARYELLVDGEPRESGTVALSQAIPATGGVVEVPVTAPYATGEALAALLENPAPLPILMRGSVLTDDGTEWRFSRAGRVRTPRVPEVDVWHVEAATYPDESKIGLVFYVRVENRNPFDIQVEELVFDLAVDGKRLVEQGRAGRKARVPPASAAELEIPVDLQADNFPGIASVIRTRRDLAYEIEGLVRLDVGRIPIHLEGPIVLGRGAPDRG